MMGVQILLSEKELLGIYMLLKAQESGLDITMSKLLNRIEKYLYQSLTIEELENLEDTYQKHMRSGS